MNNPGNKQSKESVKQYLQASLISQNSKQTLKNHLNKKLISHFNQAKERTKFKKQDSEAFYERVKNKNDLKEEKIASLKIMCKREEVKECTHQPRINKGFKSKRLQAREKISSRVNKILEEREKKRVEFKKKELEKHHSEIKQFCTFTPKINKYYRSRKPKVEKFELTKSQEQKQETLNRLKTMIMKEAGVPSSENHQDLSKGSRSRSRGRSHSINTRKRSRSRRGSVTQATTQATPAGPQKHSTRTARDSEQQIEVNMMPLKPISSKTKKTGRRNSRRQVGASRTPLGERRVGGVNSSIFESRSVSRSRRRRGSATPEMTKISHKVTPRKKRKTRVLASKSRARDRSKRRLVGQSSQKKLKKNRSVVVLNEKGEFEELGKYVKKKQRRLNKQLQKAGAENGNLPGGLKGQNSDDVDLKIVEKENKENLKVFDNKKIKEHHNSISTIREPSSVEVVSTSDINPISILGLLPSQSEIGKNPKNCSLARTKLNGKRKLSRSNVHPQDAIEVTEAGLEDLKLGHDMNATFSKLPSFGMDSSSLALKTKQMDILGITPSSENTGGDVLERLGQLLGPKEVEEVFPEDCDPESSFDFNVMLRTLVKDCNKPDLEMEMALTDPSLRTRKKSKAGPIPSKAPKRRRSGKKDPSRPTEVKSRYKRKQGASRKDDFGVENLTMSQHGKLLEKDFLLIDGQKIFFSRSTLSAIIGNERRNRFLANDMVYQKYA